MTVKTDSEFKQFFWDLVVDDKEKRSKAGHGLLASLSNKNGEQQVEYVNYSLERLVKGLGSNRECARLGFATALCELLTQHKIDIPLVLELVDKHLMVRYYYSF